MKTVSVTTVLLALIVLLLAAQVATRWNASANAQRGVEYLVVQQGPRDLHAGPEENLQRFLNDYGRAGWRLVPVSGPSNSFVFIR